MKIALIALLLLQTSAPKSSPTPINTMDNYTSASIGTPIVWSTLTTPTMVIHFSGDKILEVNGADGKHLVVAADGKITGDMPHDKAADEFWRSIAKAFPEQCHPVTQGEKP